MSKKLTAAQQDKLLVAAQNAIEFTVEGRGDFPYDMLRYDLCWPASGSDSQLIESLSSMARASATVNLKGLKYPTVGRWQSFGWKVVPS